MNYVVKKLEVSEIVVEKSRFIALLCPLSVEYDFDYYFNYAKTTYKDARHYTYALRYGFLEKASDDGEPQNTAGLPLLNLLKHHSLSNTALIVIRYFGGKKLGAGRLLRTYIDAGKSVLNIATFYAEVPAFKYLIKVAISDYDRIKYYLEKDDYTIVATEFIDLHVELSVVVSKERANSFESIYNVVTKFEDKILMEVSDGSKTKRE